MPPPPRSLTGITPLQAARSYQEAFLQEHFQSVFDSVASKLTRLGYVATSALSGEPLPRELMETFFSSSRAHSFDGVFVLDESRTNALLQKSGAIAASVSGQLLMIRRAFQTAVDGGHKLGATSPVVLWAANIVDRLRSRRGVHGAVVSEDVTTGDYAEVVEGHRTRGEFVQLGVDELPGLMSFGGLRVHFEGSVTLFGAAEVQEYLQLRLSAVLTDTFDFHEGEGTSWLDHVFVRLQRTGDAKPFRVEGRASPVVISIHATPQAP